MPASVFWALLLLNVITVCLLRKHCFLIMRASGVSSCYGRKRDLLRLKGGGVARRASSSRRTSGTKHLFRDRSLRLCAGDRRLLQTEKPLQRCFQIEVYFKQRNAFFYGRFSFPNSFTLLKEGEFWQEIRADTGQVSIPPPSATSGKITVRWIEVMLIADWLFCL